MCWILDFLTNRRQRVKLSCDCVSEWGAVPAGVPQVTKLGPWLFLIMINDLSVANTNIWKYVDDTTFAERVEKNGTSSMQSRVDEFVTKSRADGFQLNESKCKELRISFTKSESILEPITPSVELIEGLLYFSNRRNTEYKRSKKLNQLLETIIAENSLKISSLNVMDFLKLSFRYYPSGVHCAWR